jgi:transcriptional regulator with XRE-family HTH domain
MLAWLRVSRGFSLRALAKAVGISPGYLHDLESGRRPVTTRLLQRLAVALDCAPTLLRPEAEPGDAA